MNTKKPKRTLKVSTETWPLARPFVIARSRRTSTEVVVVEIEQNGLIGKGECCPTRHYNETGESVVNEINEVKAALEQGADRQQLQLIMSAGAARNAIDCALWELEARQQSKSVWQLAGLSTEPEISTVQTISIGTSDEMAADAHQLKHFPLLKIKLNQHHIIERLQAVHTAAPDAKMIIDANESWNANLLEANLTELEKLPILMIEQPLPAAQDKPLANITSSIPLGADESCHTSADLQSLVGKYQVINIKLDKCGGLTEALQLAEQAKLLGFQLMTGCMLGTSLAMAPAMIIAAQSVFVDLDAPLLLSKDRKPALKYDRNRITGLNSSLWG